MIMSTRVILQPMQLHELANQAKEDLAVVELSPEQVSDVAEAWFKDQEKIKYLESLLLRKEK